MSSQKAFWRCKKCGEQYVNTNGWCNPCEINDLKNNFTNWTSGNEIIDNLIQGMQLKIDSRDDVIFEWVPYDRFHNIEEKGEDGFAKIYSATWNGVVNKSGTMKFDRKVALKYLCSPQNLTNESLNKV